jgi:Terpene cyclase DEP1
MPISRRVLCVVYALVGLVALAGTWGNNIEYLHLGIIGANIHFWQETLVNPASRSITVDILCLALAAIVWMLLEARRLSMRGAWLWVLFGLFVAMGAAFPWFMAHRELVLGKRDPSSDGGTLSAADVLGIVLVGIAALAYTFLALSR